MRMNGKIKMGKKCSDNELFNPVLNKCVPKMGTLSTPAEQRKIAGGVVASVVLGGVLGWLLKTEEEQIAEDEEYKNELIDQYELYRFYPEIINLNLQSFIESLDTQTALDVADEIEKRSRFVFRSNWSDKTEDLAALSVLKNLFEVEAIEIDDYEKVLPIVERMNLIEQRMLQTEESQPLFIPRQQSYSTDDLLSDTGWNVGYLMLDDLSEAEIEDIKERLLYNIEVQFSEVMDQSRNLISVLEELNQRLRDNYQGDPKFWKIQDIINHNEGMISAIQEEIDSEREEIK